MQIGKKDEEIRKALKSRIYPFDSLSRYKYVVVFANYRGQWIFSRHKNRTTWESQGGHIEDGETPMDAARRELYEESGAKCAEIYPVSDYQGYNDLSSANGQVFLAVVKEMNPLPESEIAEILFSETLPENLTYPMTTPKLFEEARRVFEGMGEGNGKRLESIIQMEITPFAL